MPRAVDVAVKDVLPTLRPEDFAYHVEAAGAWWDVYRFHIRDLAGMIGFREKKRGELEIGLFIQARVSPEKAAAMIAAGQAQKT